MRNIHFIFLSIAALAPVLGWGIEQSLYPDDRVALGIVFTASWGFVWILVAFSRDEEK